MTPIVPVTDADILAAWNAMYYRDSEWAHVPIQQPKADDRFDTITLAALRRVLETDRARVVAASLTTPAES